MALQAMDENFIEVRKYRAGTTLAAAALALLLQAVLPKYIPHAELLELPLWVTVYFSMGRRNPVTSLLLGAAIGLVQDPLSHLPLGVYGIALTVVGYLASWVGNRINVDMAPGRFGLVFVLYLLERAIVAVIQRFLLEQPVALPGASWLLGALLASALAVVVFRQLDRLSKA